MNKQEEPTDKERTLMHDVLKRLSDTMPLDELNPCGHPRAFTVYGATRWWCAMCNAEVHGKAVRL